MIISVEDARKYIDTTKSDEMLEDMLQALESLIRKYTNNNFQKIAFRSKADIKEKKIICKNVLFSVGDTIQVSYSKYNEGLYVVEGIDANNITVNSEDLIDEANVQITRVVYPKDVKVGVINMLKWDLDNRNKVGIQSETISRHSVTYFNMDNENSIEGYPKSLLGFLKPYMKARF